MDKDNHEGDGAPPRADARMPSLNGIRVVDLSRVLAGPFCTQILGDHGADVIKIEPPTGDETRTWGPPFDGDTAAYYMGVNRNKRGIVLDLAQPEQREKLLGLLADADIVVENFRSGTMVRWGLGYETLAARFPKLIYCKISGFGDDGPLGGFPGYDAAVQAISGLMSVNGERGGDPLRVGVPIVDMVTGFNAALGILLALQARAGTGKGQLVEATLFDCALSILHPYMTNYLHSGNVPARSGNAHPNITPYDQFETRTGSIFLAVGNDRQFAKLCELMNRPDLRDDPRFRTNRDRNGHRDALRCELEALLREADGSTLAIELIRAGVPCAPVLGLGEIARHPHTAHREMLISIGDYQGVGAPIKLQDTPASYRRRPPMLGEHDGEILAD